MDVFALGLIVVELACEGKSLWELMGVTVRPVVIDERALLRVAKRLTDDAVREQLDKSNRLIVGALSA